MKLPPRSRLWTALNSGGVEWGSQEEILAALVQVVDIGNRVMYSGFSGKSAPWDPISITRPTSQVDSPTLRRQSSQSEVVKFFGGNVKVDD